MTSKTTLAYNAVRDAGGRIVAADLWANLQTQGMTRQQAITATNTAIHGGHLRRSGNGELAEIRLADEPCVAGAETTPSATPPPALVAQIQQSDVCIMERVAYLEELARQCETLDTRTAMDLGTTFAEIKLSVLALRHELERSHPPTSRAHEEAEQSHTTNIAYQEPNRTDY